MEMFNSEFTAESRTGEKAKRSPAADYFSGIDAETLLHVVAPDGGEQCFVTALREVWISLPDEARKEISDYWKRRAEAGEYLPRIDFYRTPFSQHQRCFSIMTADGHDLWFNPERLDELSPSDMRALIALELAYIHIRSEGGPSGTTDCLRFSLKRVVEWGYEIVAGLKVAEEFPNENTPHLIALL